MNKRAEFEEDFIGGGRPHIFCGRFHIWGDRNVIRLEFADRINPKAQPVVMASIVMTTEDAYELTQVMEKFIQKMRAETSGEKVN